MGNKHSKGRSRGVQLLLSVDPSSTSAPAAASSSPQAGPQGSPNAKKMITIDHGKINLITESNPFECSVCLNLYNESENLPTTFPCGHSLCLVHVPQLQRCPFCRAAIPPPAECHPTLALRDAAMLFAQITAEAFSKSEEDLLEGDSETVAEEFPRQSSWEMVEHQIERHQQVVRNTSSERLQRLVAVSEAALRREREQQIAQDEALARRLMHEEQREAAQRESDARMAQRLRDQQLLATTQAQLQSAPTPARPPQQHAGTRPCVACHRVCFLPARLGMCCACIDKRPMRAEGTYPIYVDGQGWVDTGRRNAGYCPMCSSQ
jgi:hypothetical protein